MRMWIPLWAIQLLWFLGHAGQSMVNLGGFLWTERLTDVLSNCPGDYNVDEALRASPVPYADGRTCGSRQSSSCGADDVCRCGTRQSGSFTYGSLRGGRHLYFNVLRNDLRHLDDGIVHLVTMH